MKMTSQKKKICMVGEFAVGKTSLTQKFVNNVFSDKYLTTVGVKIDTVNIGETKLVVWDIAGRDSMSPINLNYLVGAAGIVLVVDGTRMATITGIPTLLETVRERLGDVPCVVAINKCDADDWLVTGQQIQDLKKSGLHVLTTSAKNGKHVEEVFTFLVSQFNNN